MKYDKEDGYFYRDKVGNLRFVDRNHEYTVTKSQVKRFIKVVDSNPGKWGKNGYNSQIIDDIEFHFMYHGYDDNLMDNVFMITKYRGD